MATLNRINGKKHIENVPGLYFVDSQCIDCDLCRQSAPGFFGRSCSGGSSYSFVKKQPETEVDHALCNEAMRACPVEAIGQDFAGEA